MYSLTFVDMNEKLFPIRNNHIGKRGHAFDTRTIYRNQWIRDIRFTTRRGYRISIEHPESPGVFDNEFIRDISSTHAWDAFQLRQKASFINGRNQRASQRFAIFEREFPRNFHALARASLRVLNSARARSRSFLTPRVFRLLSRPNESPL